MTLAIPFVLAPIWRQEDETDATKAGLDLEMYRAYLRGYLETCPSLTPEELKRLPDGARLMSLECGLQLFDRLPPGRPYFATSRPGQNLDRCRTQMGLVQDMENKWTPWRRPCEEVFAMRVIVTSNYNETGKVAGGMVAKVVQDKPTATLGLATGSSRRWCMRI